MTAGRMAVALPRDRVLYRIGPKAVGEPTDWPREVLQALRSPVGSAPLAEIAQGAYDVVILADDGTRPTPQDRLLPPLLDELDGAGVRNAGITVIVALGTHRYMTEAEIESRFGPGVTGRVRVMNHAWRQPDTFVDLGHTEAGTPVRVNRLAFQADLLIGTGSIVPHIYAGWAGGAKILQPGVCSHGTTARTHCMAAESGDLLAIPGNAENPVRHEIEKVAAMAGLGFVLNVVVDEAGNAAWIGAGDPVGAHRAGVPAARDVFERPIPEPADVVVVDARPAVKDYWQGIKALAHAVRGVREGGWAVLVGSFPEGVAPMHPEFTEHALEDYEALCDACAVGRIKDRIASATLRLHALIRRHCRIVCVSDGMADEDKERLGFLSAASVEEAVAMAEAELGSSATVGIIDYGGDVLPIVE
jgi:nickel-dependent lactate racemase